MKKKINFNFQQGNNQWNSLKVPETDLYPWNLESTYIKRPPFFDDMVII